MVKSVWNGKVIAETDRTEIVQGNHYFHSASLHKEFFEPSDTHTICSWKGKAHYYTLLVDGKENAEPLGSILIQSRQRKRSPAKLRFGKAFASRPDRFVEI